MPAHLQESGTTKAAMKTTTSKQVEPAKATSAKKPAPAKKTPAAKKAATPKKTSAAKRAPTRKKTTAVRKRAAEDKAAGKKPAAADTDASAGKAEDAGAEAPAKKAAATRKRGREAATEAEPQQLPAVEHHTHQKVRALAWVPCLIQLCTCEIGTNRLWRWSSQQPAMSSSECSPRKAAWEV